MDAGLDALGAQGDHGALAGGGGGRHGNHQMVRGLPSPPGQAREKIQPHSSIEENSAVDQAMILGGQRAPALIVAGEFFKLLAAQRGADFVEPAIEPVPGHIVAEGVAAVAVPGQGGHAVRTQRAQLFGQVIAIRGDHPPFTRSQILI